MLATVDGGGPLRGRLRLPLRGNSPSSSSSSSLSNPVPTKCSSTEVSLTVRASGVELGARSRWAPTATDGLSAGSTGMGNAAGDVRASAPSASSAASGGGVPPISGAGGNASGVAMLATVDGGGPFEHESTPISPKAPSSSPSMKCVWMPTRPPGGTGDRNCGALVVVDARC